MKREYTIDEDNRLVIIFYKDGKVREKLIVDGEFTLNRASGLSYLISEPLEWRKKYGLPRILFFDGKWDLDNLHNLVFILSRRKDHERSVLRIKTEIIDVKANSLVFTVASCGKNSVQTIRLMQLKGRWQVDRQNRLSFLVQRSSTRYDSIVFKGDWEVGHHNHIIYRYEKIHLKTKTRRQGILVFKGFWDISSARRISFILSKENSSEFSFKAALEEFRIKGERGIIKYRIGVGTRGDRFFRVKIISLYGRWRFTRKRGVFFDIDYGERGVKAIHFGAYIYIGKGRKVVLDLTNRKGERVGLRMSLEKKFFHKKAKWFLSIFQEGLDRGVKGGIVIPW